VSPVSFKAKHKSANAHHNTNKQTKHTHTAQVNTYRSLPSLHPLVGVEGGPIYTTQTIETASALVLELLELTLDLCDLCVTPQFRLEFVLAGTDVAQARLHFVQGRLQCGLLALDDLRVRFVGEVPLELAHLVLGHVDALLVQLELLRRTRQLTLQFLESRFLSV
jgi:hypothetical protein